MRRELTVGEAQACFAVCEKRYGEAMFVTAYEVVRGLNRYYEDKSSLACGAPSDIYFFEAKTRREIHIQASDENIDKCIKWLREKHGIFYYEAMNLAIALEEDVSMRIANFWRLVDEENKQIEEYCKNDPACGLSLKKLHNQYGEIQRLKKECDELKEERDNLVKLLEEIDEYGYGGHVCSGCKRTTCGYFTEILSTLGVKNAVVYPPRGQSKVECFAKLANERAQAVMKENRVMARTIDTHVERLNNQEEIIKTQNKSLERQARQLKDLGVALGNVKNTVDFEIDTLMSDYGDEIIPEF